MKRYKPGQFFYIVNRQYRSWSSVRPGEDRNVPLLIEVISSKKKKTKKRKQPLSAVVLYTLEIHEGTRTKDKVHVKDIYEWGISKISGPSYIRHSQLTSYITNNAIEQISEVEAAKMMLTGSDKFYASPAYDRLLAKSILEGRRRK